MTTSATRSAGIFSVTKRSTAATRMARTTAISKDMGSEPPLHQPPPLPIIADRGALMLCRPRGWIVFSSGNGRESVVPYECK